MRLLEIETPHVSKSTGPAMTFYHGTTSKVLSKIKRHGLTPQDETDSFFRGNMSTIPGYTRKMVFLTPVVREAWFYADLQSHERGGRPVILEVKVYPTDPLRVTDDYILDQVKKSIMEAAGFAWITTADIGEDGAIHTNSPSGEFYRMLQRLLAYGWKDFMTRNYGEMVHGGSLGRWAGYFYSEEEARRLRKLSDDGWPGMRKVRKSVRDKAQAEHEKLAATILERIHAALEIGRQRLYTAMQDSWRASIATDRDPAVAFEGTIPPDRIRELNTKQVAAAGEELARVGRGTGQAADYGLPPAD
jgi:hypothetical protein